MSITPPLVETGAKVALVPTARKVNDELLRNAVELVEKAGYVPVSSSNISSTNFQFAGTDAERAEGLQEMLDDPDISAILCMRGGYGSNRIIDRLDFAAFKRSPKWLAGFSDVTVLHSHINNALNICTIHSFMPSTAFMSTEESITSLFTLLNEGPKDIEFDMKERNVLGSCRGKLMGGNLSIVQSLIGTESAFKGDGAILFLEDLDEMLYHIDRMMVHLKRSGAFKGIKGVLIGGMSDMRDNTPDFDFKTDDPFGSTAEEIIAAHVSGLGLPVAFGFPAGHTELNQAFILGADVALHVEKTNSRLVYT